MSKSGIANGLQIAGAVSISAAAFLSNLVFGFLATGVCVLLAGVIVERD